MVIPTSRALPYFLIYIYMYAGGLLSIYRARKKKERQILINVLTDQIPANLYIKVVINP